MTAAKLRDWADSWRQIPLACDSAKCKWRGPFPASPHKWQLRESAVGPTCAVHGNRPGPVAAEPDAGDLAVLQRLVQSNPELVRAQISGGAV